MKNLFLIFAMVPMLVFGQISKWRTEGPRQTTPNIPHVSTPAPQQNNVSRWRTETSPIRPGHEIQQPSYRSYRPTIINPYGLYYGTYGYYRPYPYYWYDNYGWRQRSEIRIYENGKIDTVIKKPLLYSVGLGHTTNHEMLYWANIGGEKGYFIMDYVMTYEIDRNSYFPYGNLAVADFPISKDLFRKESTLYLGGGKRFGKYGIHGMIGFGNEILRYQGKDDLGGISFPKSNTNYTTFKFGILREFKYFTLRLDRDPIRGYNQFGIGLKNF
jgi:hypothetical protein